MKPIEIIKVYRKKRNYTQEDIAKELNIDRTTYNNIEKGKNNLGFVNYWNIRNNSCCM